MKGRETQLKKCYRMLLAGATTNEFCDDHRLRNNWRARKTEIGHLIKALGGDYHKELLPKDGPDEPDNYYYKIVMPARCDQEDPLGMFSVDSKGDSSYYPDAATEDGQGIML